MTTVDDPEQLHKDAEAAKVAFEKFLLAPYEAEVTPECDVEMPVECNDPAEWWAYCNNCHHPFFWCGPHHNTYAVACHLFGGTVRCSKCKTAGPLDVTFTLGLLRSPA